MRRRAMGVERRLVVIALQHDIYVGVARLVQGVELVARLVGPHLGLQGLHGRLEVGIGAGLYGQFGDDAEHGRSSAAYWGRFFTRYLCSPSQTSTAASLWMVSFSVTVPVVRPAFSSLTSSSG